MRSSDKTGLHNFLCSPPRAPNRLKFEGYKSHGSQFKDFNNTMQRVKAPKQPGPANLVGTSPEQLATTGRSNGTGQVNRRRPQLVFTILTTPAAFFVAVTFLLPVLYTLIISFQSLSTLSIGTFGRWIGFSNYTSLLSVGGLSALLENTVFWQAGITTLLKLIIGLAIALVLQTRYIANRKLRALLRTMMIAIWAVPPVAASALWRWMLAARYGVIDQILQLIVGHPVNASPLASLGGVWPSLISLMTWNGLPFAALVLLGGLETVPSDLYEAAHLDGAGALGRLRYVTMPSIVPTIAILGVLMFLELFNNFVYVWITTGGGPGTASQVLATTLYSRAFVDLQLGAAAAVGVVTSIIALSVTMLYYLLILRKIRIAQ